MGDGDKPLPFFPELPPRRVECHRKRIRVKTSDEEVQLTPSMPNDIPPNLSAIAALRIEKHALEDELNMHKAREAELKSCIDKAKNNQATKVFLADLPHHVADWLHTPDESANYQRGGSVSAGSNNICCTPPKRSH